MDAIRVRMSGDIDLSLYAGGYMYVILVRLRNALQGFGRNFIRFRDSSKDGNTFWLHQELKALKNYFALFFKSCIKYLCHRLTHTFKKHNTDEMLFIQSIVRNKWMLFSYFLDPIRFDWKAERKTNQQSLLKADGNYRHI
jgi:hypothetical protein